MPTSEPTMNQIRYLPWTPSSLSGRKVYLRPPRRWRVASAVAAGEGDVGTVMRSLGFKVTADQ
ncbi:hypothetical protein DRB96_25010 [Streptomyces sp. ICC1]|nr:hypothetical protein DRB89_24700 [Streptomyces sp. ICC4]AWZ14976.1 hypothetical protein DRB96_25010 [Streptomyces sp. ICC1]